MTSTLYVAHYLFNMKTFWMFSRTYIMHYSSNKEIFGMHPLLYTPYRTLCLRKGAFATLYVLRFFLQEVV